MVGFVAGLLGSVYGVRTLIKVLVLSMSFWNIAQICTGKTMNQHESDEASIS
jgi:hypothetical protein